MHLRLHSIPGRLKRFCERIISGDEPSARHQYFLDVKYKIPKDWGRSGENISSLLLPREVSLMLLDEFIKVRKVISEKSYFSTQ